MNSKVELFKVLFEEIHLKHSHKLKAQYEKICKELVEAGYSVEQGFGYYLHCPDGTTITLDYWNEDKDEAVR